MSKSLIAFLVAGAAVVTLVVIGLSQTKTTSSKPVPSALTAAQMQARLAGSPPPLAALHAQGSQLLGGGRDAIKARIASFKGHPVVVNKWASWCAPCRAEFPSLQNASVQFGRRVAFVGLNSGDNKGDAATFLKRFPITYPSYEDPREKAAIALGASGGYPITIFYNAAGKKVYEHQGAYPSEQQLVADIRQYALSS